MRNTIEGEHHLQGFIKAYLALTNYYLLQPELEMNYGYCDFFLLPDKEHFPDIRHSYILEVKYAQDTKALYLAQGTTLHKILIQFKGWELVRSEEYGSL